MPCEAGYTGLSELYGSWNTICTWLRYDRKARWDRTVEIDRPRYRMSPAVGR